MGIGEAARRAGVKPSAIRYYEEVGLLAEPPHAGGKRRYDEGVFRCLANIEGAKRAGFTIGQMRAYFYCSSTGQSVQECHRALVRRKLEEVEASISPLLEEMGDARSGSAQRMRQRRRVRLLVVESVKPRGACCASPSFSPAR